MILVIDKGHIPGKDPGACGNGLQEADLTGFIGDAVKNCLTDYNVEVYFAPRGELTERSAFANAAEADFFLSIHVNAGDGTGFESYACQDAPQATIKLCEGIHTDLASFYASRGIADRGLKRSNFAVLRKTAMPAMLLENLFIDNARDAEFLKDKKFLLSLGYTIAMAIVSAFSLKRKVINVPGSPSWKTDAVQRAYALGLIKELHPPDEQVDMGTLCAMLVNLYNKLKGV